MNERIIDAIIFGTNCIKAQDKLLQTLKTLSLQQCITVCIHYESLSLHIQQIWPDNTLIFEKMPSKVETKQRQISIPG